MYRLLIGLALLCPAPSWGWGEDWEECRSGPFEVYTNGPEREARQLLVRLEQMRHVLGQLLGKTEPVSLWPMRVVIVKGRGTQLAAWTLGRDAWVSVIASGSAPPRVWQRDVARMLLESNARRIPKSWENGVEDFLSTLEAQGPKVTLGAPPPAAERNQDWARVQFLATNPEYFGRLRVMMNNIQNGAEEEVAYRNSLGKTKAELEGLIAKYFAAGEFAPTVIAGRAIAEKDYYMKPLELPRAMAALGDAAGNPKLPAEGTLEWAEGLGLQAAKEGERQRALQLLREAVEGGTKSARVHLEYGLLLGDEKEKRAAYVEAAKKNPRWAEPYVELSILESAPARQAFYLKTAAALDPRNTALWQRLAKTQLDAKEFSEASKSWFAAELSAPTPEERAKIAVARRQFEEDRLNRETAERKRVADERQQELDRLKEQAMNSIRQAEAKARSGMTPLEPGRKVEEWWDDKEPSQKISGVMQKVDCVGPAARIWVVPAGGKPVPLLIRNPGEIVVMGGGEAAFGCGAQKPARRVNVEYKARKDAKLATIGDVAVIEFR